MTTLFDTDSPAWSIRLIAEFAASDQKARDVVSGLSREQLNWQPGAAWSVGQCLEHLCITNDVYLLEISNSLQGKPIAPVQEIIHGWLGGWFIRTFIEPSPKSKHARAPKKIKPGLQVELEILDRFLRSNGMVRKLVHRAREYDVNRIRFKNPFSPVLRFTVGTGLEIVSRHQRRHLLQAERVRSSPDFPG